MKPRRTLNLSQHLSKPVIPYLTKGVAGQPKGLSSASVLFVGGGELAELPKLLDALSREPYRSLPVFLHMDLVNGLSNDDSGLKYVATLNRVDGVITVRHHLAPLARKLGLLSVVRLFLQDGRAVERGVQVVEKSSPDAIELLPGVAFLEVAHRFQRLGVPCIAGGLIRTEEIVRRILAAGCQAVSTTNESLWMMNVPSGVR